MFSGCTTDAYNQNEYTVDNNNVPVVEQKYKAAYRNSQRDAYTVFVIAVIGFVVFIWMVTASYNPRSFLQNEFTTTIKKN